MTNNTEIINLDDYVGNSYYDEELETYYKIMGYGKDDEADIYYFKCLVIEILTNINGNVPLKVEEYNRIGRDEIYVDSIKEMEKVNSKKFNMLFNKIYENLSKNVNEVYEIK